MYEGLRLVDRTLPRKPAIEDPLVTHKKCVYSDAEFIAEARAIASHLGIGAKHPIDKIYHRFKYHYYVGERAEIIATDADEASLKKLASEYAITISDVIVFLNDGHNSSTYEYSKPRVEVSYSPHEGIKIFVPPDATKQDIVSQLYRVRVIQKLFYKRQDTKRKPPANYQLIYAIFRARAKGLTFDRIYRQYQVGALPMYDRASNLNSPDSLARYYRKYKPTTGR